MEQTKSKHGYLGCIFGPMFGGKSTKILHYIRKYKTLGYKMIVAKPSIDTRYTESNEICTHNYEKESCTTFSVDGLYNIFTDENYNDAAIIIIEEAQFFSSLYDIVKRMTDQDKKIVYVAALNGDSNRELFGDVYKLLPLCDNIEFMQALCIKCKDGTPAIYSKRISDNKEQVLVAGASSYQATCREHYFSD